MKKNIWIIFSVACLSFLAACGGGKANVIDYIDIDFEGENGEGVAEYDVEWMGYSRMRLIWTQV